MMSQSAFPAAAPRRRWLLFLRLRWCCCWQRPAPECGSMPLRARRRRSLYGASANGRPAGRKTSIGGYPFRIEVRCGGASFELRGTPTLQLKPPLAVVAVQVYDPKLLIGEFNGPLEISEPGGPPAGIVNWTLVPASVPGLPAGLIRASLALVEPTVRDPSSAANDAVFRP